MSNDSNKTDSATLANSNDLQPKLYDLAESAIQNLLRDNPALTRAEVVEMLDAFGFLDKRFFIPQ